SHVLPLPTRRLPTSCPVPYSTLFRSKVRMMSFTGSGGVGAKIMEKASEDFKKVSLELGGKSPYIVLADADIKSAAEAAVGKVVNNTGQECTAGSRTIIPKSMKEQFLAAAKEKMSTLKVGDPQSEETDLGPLINQKQYDGVQNYIEKGIDEGASLIYGGAG